MVKKIQLEEFLKSLPQFQEDRWGNFKSDNGGWRYKLGKTAVRFEHKIIYDNTEYGKGGSDWMKKWSAYYKNIDFVDTEKGTKLNIKKRNR